MVGTHVADGVNRRNNPQQTGYRGKQQSKWLQVEGKRKPGERFHQHDTRAFAGLQRKPQPHHKRKQCAGSNQRHGLARVGAPAQHGDQYSTGKWHRDR